MTFSLARRLLPALCLALVFSHDAIARKSKVRATAAAQDGAESYAQRQDVRDFALQVAERRELPPQWVQAQLAQARLQPAAQRLMMPPSAARRRTGPPTATASSSRSA